MSTTFGQMVTLLLVCFIWLDINQYQFMILNFNFKLFLKHYTIKMRLFCIVILD